MNTIFRPDMLKFLLIFILLLAYAPFALAQDATQANKAVGEIPPIYLVAKQGNLSVVRSLIASGSDVNTANASGRSALMSAVFFRNRGIVRELLTEGANVNSVDAQGRTALMIAVVTKDMKMIDLLLGSGADVTIEDKTKNTAITLAEKTRNKKLLKLLENSAS
jgi:ankyrin repeat protein